MDGNLTTIGIFGEVNTGKSTLFNILLNENRSIVSAQAGTTTDSVFKLIELGDLGRVKLIDTAGLGDESALGRQRMEAALITAESVDIAIIIRVAEDEGAETLKKTFDKYTTPYIEVINSAVAASGDCGGAAIKLNFNDKKDIEYLLKELLKLKKATTEKRTITRDLVRSGDTVVLVMPQDESAPEGRLILPQSQIIRELLDKGCVTVAVTPQTLTSALNGLKEVPNLVITDSSVFNVVSKITPKESKLTSFSVLFAGFKGDIKTFIDGAKAFDTLPKCGKILILEACSHTPKNEDIGRVKLPMKIKKAYGEDITIDVVNGLIMPKNLADYDLIIHCGACMFSRKIVLNRILQAQESRVPITNYGVALAKLDGILDEIVY